MGHQPIVPRSCAACPISMTSLPRSVCALADMAVPIRYSAGTLIFVEGDPCAGLYLIEEGIVKISRFSKDGREYILHLSHRGRHLQRCRRVRWAGKPGQRNRAYRCSPLAYLA